MAGTLEQQPVFELPGLPLEATFPMLVLQPTGNLDATGSRALQEELEATLNQATVGVIVDLLWVETIDAAGIEVLVVGLQKAASIGKSLLFQGMDARTQTALELEWSRQKQLGPGTRSCHLSRELERYLESLADRRQVSRISA